MQLTYETFKTKLKGFEGYASHLYLDTAGKVTIGVGLMFGTANQLVNSGIKFRFKNSGAEAKPEDIREEFKRVAKSAAGQSVSTYDKITKLQGDEGQLEGEFEKRMGIAENDAIKFFGSAAGVSKDERYSAFYELPVNIQYALIDMAFNLGLPRLGKYRSLRRALKAGNWDEAAAQCERRGIGSSRNQAIRQWILDAKNVYWETFAGEAAA